MLKTFLTMFSGPIGNAITNGITAGSAAFVTYATTKGMDVGTASTIAVGGAGVVAAAINWGAGLLGVQMNVINTGNNGLKVTRDSADAPKVTAPLK